ncbi:sigma-54 factor interaction domain-containing protein [uncultured Megasphaera sp.]|uniref:sigma-54 factor interaction domain-containing protein n=1 Tax=uncultured Megasphaera sp. TaxID=165188 RepID=UPI002804C610|nr:sigma-54 factor interaction domain-containing protein [uncultured Megasphaera sp.]
MLAQAIHNLSHRRYGPFVAVNCGSITESLLESELFGYVGGTFTGANRDGKIGLFEAANGGTLFLDEVGDMPYVLQNRLLRVLQEKYVCPVGSQHGVPIDVRVIAATNKNLPQEVRKGNFRLDLYYRLSVLPI